MDNALIKTQHEISISGKSISGILVAGLGLFVLYFACLALYKKFLD